MKRVLIMGYLHPFARSGGSFRTLPLAKHLPEFGYKPTVLTPFLIEKAELPFRVIETPYRDAPGFWEKLFRFDPDKDIRGQVKERFGTSSKNSLIDIMLAQGGKIVNYPDPHKGWRSFALKAGSELLQQENVDALISCHPVTSHMVANDLKNKYRIPWIADFADLWSQNPNYGYGSLRRMLDRKLEVQTLSNAEALITVSEPGAEKLRALHKGHLVYAITHGFNPAEVNVPPAKLTTKFTITYTGSIYTRRQDPSKLFAALQGLIFDKIIGSNEVEVLFYGAKHDWLQKEIEQYGLSNIVKQYGLVPRETALEKQRESQLLLLLKWEDPKERGVYTGKIFEYLAAKRPILATGGSHDVVTELLDETETGICAVTVDHIKNVLKELYKEYKLKGEVNYRGKELEITKYSHREMARRFSEVLNQLT